MNSPSPKSKVPPCDESAKRRGATAAAKNFPPLQERRMGMHVELHDEFDLVSAPLGTGKCRPPIALDEKSYEHNLF